MSDAERERLAQALEEAAMLVRRHAPVAVAYDVRDEVNRAIVTRNAGAETQSIESHRRPELRAFRIEW